MDAELKDAAATHLGRRETVGDLLTRAAARRQHLLVNNRLIYQELEELRNKLLSTQRSEADVTDQDERTRAAVEALRKEFPRLLAKMTKTPVQNITVEELPSTINRVEDQLSTLIKVRLIYAPI